MQSVPTNLVTGFLGVGKTTAVIDLLQRKAAGSRWAVLVNEYGAVSIDDALIEGSAPEGVTVKEVGGGCVCCAAAPFLPVAIHFLLLEARPERLIIETTGLGHPARLLDSLRMSYHGRLDVRGTIGIFDPTSVFDEGKLLALLANTRAVTRLKGVFRVADEWIAVNRAGSAVSVSPTAYRRDSRLEVFADALDWDTFEQQLVGCLLPR